MSNQIKRQIYAEAYGMGDILIGRSITGKYPNETVFTNKNTRTLDERTRKVLTP